MSDSDIDDPADVEESATDGWRRLALQFDGHRMAALSHLRMLLAEPEKHRAVVEAFLAAPPLSGAEVLAERINEIVAKQPVLIVRATKPCPYCVGRIGRICTTCEDCMGSGEVPEKTGQNVPAFIAPMLPPDGCHPGYGGCTCSCHRMSGVHHVMPCCYPESPQKV